MSWNQPEPNGYRCNEDNVVHPSSADHEFNFKDGSFDLTSRERDPGYLILPSTITVVPQEKNCFQDDADDLSDSVFKEIAEMLMADDTDQKSVDTSFDPLALKAAEKSLYEVLGQKYPHSHDDQAVLCANSLSGMIHSSPSTLPFASSCNGMEETSSTNYFFRPENQYSSIIDTENYDSPPMSKCDTPKKERENLRSGAERKKDLRGKNVDYVEEGRSNKRLTIYTEIYTEEDELAEMYDRILLCPDDSKKLQVFTSDDDEVPQNGRTGIYDAKKSSIKKTLGKNRRAGLRRLLLLCAQAVAFNDSVTAHKLLNQIRQQSSALGDGSERTGHYFANALEARLGGTGFQSYAASSLQRLSVVHQFRLYRAIALACPFFGTHFSFSNHNILNLVEKVSTLHIIDLGFSYGFQWPKFIQDLSVRLGGPPKLRITVIVSPKFGLQAAKLGENVGHRLIRYCKRFNVPFEYYLITQKLENIQIEDLKIDGNELTIVNCLRQLEYLFDETIMKNSPRTSVLKLILKINPNIFILGINNGSYNSPFFIPRFRNTLLGFSSWFDMFDNILSHEEWARLMFEKQYFGPNIMNVIACEGLDRVDRTATYKYWQVQIMNMGFRQLPLDSELVKILRAKMASNYDKNFFINEDGHWAVQGWKGRVLRAISCWIPARES
ncbi:scarecrow-like protein 14 [Malania oleifera]|uniref:scarecrow-like protein 14 n=1 Tax=Malania oleifera TaxID=397392 RepID=UPI0025AE3FBF|nr:scarecrow-like protein 14 [Malania oleifera]